MAQTSGAVVGSGVITWSSLPLSAGAAGYQSITLQLPSGLAPGSVLAQSVSLLPTTTGVIGAYAGTETYVGSTDALDVAVSASPDPVVAGQTVTYSIHVSNPGTLTSGGFALRASVPNYTTVTAAQAGGGACTGAWPCVPGEEVYWSLDLVAGQSATEQFSATVAGTAPPPNGTVLSTTVTSGTGGSAVADVVVASAGPTLSLTAPEQVPVGSTYTYTATYGNAGATAATTQLVMAVPAGTTLVSTSTGATVNGSLVSWPVTSLAAGQSASQQLTVKAPTSAGTVVSASAELTNGATAPLSDTRASVDTVIGSTDALDVAVSASPDPVVAGQTVTYSIHVSNPGTLTSGGFALRASVPNYTTVTAAQAGGGACTGAWPCVPGEEVYWSLDLVAGQSATEQFSATVAGTAPPPNGTVLSTTVTSGTGGSAVADVVVN